MPFGTPNIIRPSQGVDCLDIFQVILVIWCMIKYTQFRLFSVKCIYCAFQGMSIPKQLWRIKLSIHLSLLMFHILQILIVLLARAHPHKALTLWLHMYFSSFTLSSLAMACWISLFTKIYKLFFFNQWEIFELEKICWQTLVFKACVSEVDIIMHLKMVFSCLY